MSISYPVTLNQIFTHNLAFPRGGAVQIENNSNLYVYVALTYRSTVDDVIAQNIMTVPPYASHTRVIIPGSFAPVLSLVATDRPYAIAATIGGSQATVRINEYSDPKAAPGDESDGVIIADRLIVAGGLIAANQEGLYVIDQAGHEVLAVNLDANHPWAAQVLQNGDLMIGRGTEFLYWDASTGQLIVSGSINVTGGNAVRVVSIQPGFTVSGPDEFKWVAPLTVELSNGQSYVIPAHTFSGIALNSWLYLNPAVPELYLDDKQPAGGDLVIGRFVLGTLKGTLYIYNGGTLISGDSIVTGSIVTSNLSATAIDGMLITGATIRTNAAPVPDVQVDATGINIRADDNGWLKWVDTAAGNVANVRGTFTAGLNHLKIFSNGLLNRARGILDVLTGSAAGAAGGLSADLGGAIDKVEIRHTRPGASNGIAFRLLNMAAELCDYGGAALTGLIIGAAAGTAPTAKLDVRGDMVATGPGTFQSVRTVSAAAPGVDNISAAGSMYATTYNDQSGHAGLSTTVTLAKLTAGGVTGLLSFSGGILIAKIDPT